MRKLQKSMAVVLCACFILTACFSFVFIASYADHDCSGESCEICLHLEQAANAFRNSRAFIPVSILFFAVSVFFLQILLFMQTQRKKITLISLNVQMNN